MRVFCCSLIFRQGNTTLKPLPGLPVYKKGHTDVLLSGGRGTNKHKHKCLGRQFYVWLGRAHMWSFCLSKRLSRYSNTVLRLLRRTNMGVLLRGCSLRSTLNNKTARRSMCCGSTILIATVINYYYNYYHFEFCYYYYACNYYYCYYSYYH